jgi:AmiR/NasT family two-component response regulator
MPDDSKRIIVIDDDPIITSIIKNVLINSTAQGMTFRVDVFNCGIEGLVALNNGAYDLMFLDYKLPEISGVELLSKIVTGHKPPFIMVTSSDEPDVVNAVNDQGALNYIKKPIEPDAIIPKVLIALNRSQDQQELQVENRKLTERLETSSEFNVACGILMVKHMITQKSARSLLLSHSRSNNIKTIDLANDIISGQDRDGSMAITFSQHAIGKVCTQKLQSTLSKRDARKSSKRN